MKKIIATAFVLFGAVALTACEDGTKTNAKPGDTVPTTIAVRATLPDFTGVIHQEAQDTAQAVGFYNLHEQDASGQGRMLILDRNWTVCSQSPAPGLYLVTQPVTLRSVKVGELCP